MKGQSDRTKVVLRHLPPTISQSNIVEHIDSRFSGRYSWLAFRPGKSSTKHLTHSRAYIEFVRPEDVIEFAEFFSGHVFVNEKGAQFKAIVEYAPSQRVPQQRSKKDGREGTVLKDPEYMEFLEFLKKPVENLPSAEIQLERKEAEQAGAPKDVPIVTPLMEYVRQKRIAKIGTRRTVVNGKSSRKGGGISSKSLVPGSSKRGSEKRTSTIFALKDSSKGVGDKDKPTFMVVSRHNDQELTIKSNTLTTVSRADAPKEETGGSGSTGIVKEKILLVKGKEKETSDDAFISSDNSHSLAPFRHKQRNETNKRIIRSILLNKDTHHIQSSLGSQSEQRTPASNKNWDKKPPQPPITQSLKEETNGIPKDKEVNNESYVVCTEKQERRIKNRDKPDRGVWTPIRHLEGSHASDNSFSSAASRTSQIVDSEEGTNVDAKNEMLVTHSGNYRHAGSSRNSHYFFENGSYRNGGRRGSTYDVKDADGYSVGEGKPLKHGGPSGYGAQEKQLWVPKPSSGS